jgi:hypothetical protein
VSLNDEENNETKNLVDIASSLQASRARLVFQLKIILGSIAITLRVVQILGIEVEETMAVANEFEQCALALRLDPFTCFENTQQ